jgi:dimethylargininase
VEVLPADDAAPDGCFVEDTALVLDEIALMTNMGAASRRRESGEIARALAPFRAVVRLEPPSTLDGGDVLVVGRRIFVGLSRRTSAGGAAVLAEVLEPLGYVVIPTKVRECLHLKSALTAVDDETLLVNPAWVDLSPFSDLRTLRVPDDEPRAANVLRLGATLLVAASFPRTQEMLGSRGHAVRSVDISELMKAEAGLTCLSLVFRG